MSFIGLRFMFIYNNNIIGLINVVEFLEKTAIWKNIRIFVLEFLQINTSDTDNDDQRI